MEAYRPSDLPVWIAMERSVRRDLGVLLVEGPDDEKFWYRRHDELVSVLRNMGGKEGVISGLEHSERRGIQGVVGVVDTDWDQLENPGSTITNLCRTDTHDLESLLIFSGALESVLVEYGDKEKVRVIEQKEGSIREALLTRGLPFGKLRWLCRQQNRSQEWISARIDKETWEVDWQELASQAIKQGLVADVEELKLKIQPLPDDKPWQLCQGKDLGHILAVGLSKKLGNRQVNAANVISLLRQSLQPHDFERLNVHHEIRRWQQRNPPFRVLPTAAYNAAYAVSTTPGK